MIKVVREEGVLVVANIFSHDGVMSSFFLLTFQRVLEPKQSQKAAPSKSKYSFWKCLWNSSTGEFVLYYQANYPTLWFESKNM